MVAYNTGLDPIEIDDLGPKVKVTVTQNSFSTQFFVNSFSVNLSFLMFDQTEILYASYICFFSDLYLNFIKIKLAMTTSL